MTIQMKRREPGTMCMYRFVEPDGHWRYCSRDGRWTGRSPFGAEINYCTQHAKKLGYHLDLRGPRS